MASFLFNVFLDQAGIAPRDVRLLRHQKAGSRRTPYSLWRDDQAAFERYQSCQTVANSVKFAATHWASFVATPDGGTLFAGMYAVAASSIAPPDWVDPLTGRSLTDLHPDKPCLLFDLQRVSDFDDLAGRLRIEWGEGRRSWVQRADSATGNKPVVELTPAFREPDFPGHLALLTNLAALPGLPIEWVGALRSARGVYLLTCPRTKEQYVGSAYGVDGFWGRWQSYVTNAHGGNVALRSRDPEDYQVSILEVAGSNASNDDIIAMEQLWKAKLQSREMGLNRN